MRNTIELDKVAKESFDIVFIFLINWVTIEWSESDFLEGFEFPRKENREKAHE